MAYRRHRLLRQEVKLQPKNLLAAGLVVGSFTFFVFYLWSGSSDSCCDWSRDRLQRARDRWLLDLQLTSVLVCTIRLQVGPVGNKDSCPALHMVDFESSDMKMQKRQFKLPPISLQGQEETHPHALLRVCLNSIYCTPYWLAKIVFTREDPAVHRVSLTRWGCGGSSYIDPLVHREGSVATLEPRLSVIEIYWEDLDRPRSFV